MGRKRLDPQVRADLTTAIAREDFPSVYLDLLRAVRCSYLTTFVTTDTSAVEAHNRVALDIQHAKIRAGVDIRRLFITQDQTQLDAHQPLMRAQTGLGIQVRHLPLEVVHADPVLRGRLDHLGGLDFAVIDGEQLLRTTIIMNRQGCHVGIDHASLDRDPRLVAQFGVFFGLLWDKAADHPTDT